MVYDFDPIACAVIEGQLIAEGSVERIVKTAQDEAKSQFSNSKTDEFGASMLCLRSAAIMLVNTLEVEEKNLENEFSMLSSACDVASEMFKAHFKVELAKRLKL